MIVREAKKFYKQDNKKYQLEKNKEFLKWYKDIIKSGYRPFIDVEDSQNLIDRITTWYELKYPERDFCISMDVSFSDSNTLSQEMSIKQLLYRLNNKQLDLMKCNYNGNCYTSKPIYENGKLVGTKTVISIRIDNKKDRYDYFLILADATTGKILNDTQLKEYLDDEDNKSLDRLLEIFSEKYNDELNFEELQETINDHNYDLELRNKILQMVALKLLYSKNTIPEVGHSRAKKFINEFNQELNLNLSTQEIDELINKDYINGEKWEWVLKTYRDNEGNEITDAYYMNTATNSDADLRKKGLKRLIKK